MIIRDTDRRQCAGFSLLDLMVTMLLISIVALSLGSLSISTTRFYAQALGRDELLDRTRRVVDEISRELFDARVLSIGDLGDENQIVLVVPVDVGEDSNDNGLLDAGEDEDGDGVLDLTDGDVTTAGGTIQWGCMEVGGARLDLPGSEHRVTYTFVAQAVVDESAIGADLNLDGDTSDTFEVGSVTRTTSNGAIRFLGSQSVVMGSPDGPADLNGDGVPDPLFSVTGEAFSDSNSNGIYDVGEGFTDTNGNETWDGRWRLGFILLLEDENGEVQFIHMERESALRNLE